MRKRLGTILAASGAIALTIGLGSASVSASAATTWTVKPGGAFSGTSTLIYLMDTNTGLAIACTSSEVSGTLKNGSGLTNPLATLSNATFSNCTGPAGMTFKVPTSAFPWDLNGTSYSSGTMKGTITGIHAVLEGINIACTATIDGTSATANNGNVVINHNNSAPAKLRVLQGGDNLHAYKVSNCLGELNSGDPMALSGTYTLTKGQTISSP